MVKSREELIAVASDWATQAKNDMRNQISHFMHANHLDVSEMAHILGMSDGELDQILRGNGEISLTTFSKLIVGTDSAVVILPAAEAERMFGRPGGGPRPMSHEPEMVCPRPIPHEPEMEEVRPLPRATAASTLPPRDARGRFVKQDTTTPVFPDFHRMNRMDLIYIIEDNGWDDEIDIDDMTRGELIDFLIDKFSQTKTEAKTKGCCCTKPTDGTVGVGVTDPVAKVLETMHGVLEKNPQILERLMSLFGEK